MLIRLWRRTEMVILFWGHNMRAALFHTKAAASLLTLKLSLKQLPPG